MAQYDVYLTRSGNYLLEVQSNLLEDLPTRLVVPIYPDGPNLQKIKRLHPVLSFDGRDYVMATHQMLAVPKSDLKEPRANLTANHDDIMRAIYLVIQGF